MLIIRRFGDNWCIEGIAPYSHCKIWKWSSDTLVQHKTCQKSVYCLCQKAQTQQDYVLPEQYVKETQNQRLCNDHCCLRILTIMKTCGLI